MLHTLDIEQLYHQHRPHLVLLQLQECKYGDIDLGVSGDGRWGVEWYSVSSGGLTTQSTGSVKRAAAPKKKTYNWRRWLRIIRARRKAALRKQLGQKGRKLLVLGA